MAMIEDGRNDEQRHQLRHRGNEGRNGKRRDCHGATFGTHRAERNKGHRRAVRLVYKFAGASWFFVAGPTDTGAGQPGKIAAPPFQAPHMSFLPALRSWLGSPPGRTFRRFPLVARPHFLSAFADSVLQRVG